MRKFYDWPFRDRPEINGAFFAVVFFVWMTVLAWIAVTLNAP